MLARVLRLLFGTGKIILKSALAFIRLGGGNQWSLCPWKHLFHCSQQYLFNKNPKFSRFYLLPKIDKRLHNVSGRPVISDSGYCKEKISSFLDYHLQPLVKKSESQIKDTNHFKEKS